jgi:hypothetical protein
MHSGSVHWEIIADNLKKTAEVAGMGQVSRPKSAV